MCKKFDDFSLYRTVEKSDSKSLWLGNQGLNRALSNRPIGTRVLA